MELVGAGRLCFGSALWVLFVALGAAFFSQCGKFFGTGCLGRTGFFLCRGTILLRFVDHAEIDLPFKTVDSFDLYPDVLGEGIGFLFAATDDFGAILAEVIEIVIEGGDVDHPKCHGIGKFDEKAVIFDVGYDGGECLLMVFIEFALIEFQKLGLNGFAFGINAIAFGHAEVFTEGIELRLRVSDVGFFKRGIGAVFTKEGIEDAVHHEVGITPNGRGEVGVVAFSEAVVSVG